MIRKTGKYREIEVREEEFVDLRYFTCLRRRSFRIKQLTNDVIDPNTSEHSFGRRSRIFSSEKLKSDDIIRISVNPNFAERRFWQHRIEYPTQHRIFRTRISVNPKSRHFERRSCQRRIEYLTQAQIFQQSSANPKFHDQKISKVSLGVDESKSWRKSESTSGFRYIRIFPNVGLGSDESNIRRKSEFSESGFP